MRMLDRRMGRTEAHTHARHAARLGRDALRGRGRAGTETLLRRAGLLPRAADRLLIEEALGVGRSIRELAALHRTTPRRLERRLLRLRRALSHPVFVFAADHADQLPDPVRRVVRAHYVRHLSLRECARRFGLTLHEVRQRLAIAQSLVRLQAEAQAAEADGRLPAGDSERG